MPIFTPYTSATPLPPIGTREDLVLDFKRLPSKRKGAGDERDPASWDHVETAKDIAAFANAVGGTLLFGADDDGGTGILQAYFDLDDGLADAIEKHVTDALKDRVRPAPVLPHAVRIRRGIHVHVAVNIHPFAGQAVGAHVGGNAYAFPVRVKDQNVAYHPEHLPMLMIPELRRIVNLLRQIAPTDVVQMHTGRFHPNTAVPVRIVSVDEIANALRVRDLGASPDEPDRVWPLDAVRLVWMDNDNWRLVVSYLRDTNAPG